MPLTKDLSVSILSDLIDSLLIVRRRVAEGAAVPEEILDRVAWQGYAVGNLCVDLKHTQRKGGGT